MLKRGSRIRSDRSKITPEQIESGEFLLARARYDLPEWTEEQRERMRAYSAIVNEVKNEKGEIDKEELKRHRSISIQMTLISVKSVKPLEKKLVMMQ
jgi:hypothetical protein